MTDAQVVAAVLRARTLEAAAAVLEAEGCPPDRSYQVAAQLRDDPAGYDVLVGGAAVLPASS